ncbi:MAG: DUF1501 domain-containing protein [Pirellulaceae bacterium]|nr:DUF1501 domain-containing protein [Pirellulaceae bacterium]
MHCRRFMPSPISRRSWLKQTASGFGSVALAALMSNDRSALANPIRDTLHHQPTARNIIFLYMDGGVSQVDSFDPKPILNERHGQPFAARIAPTQFNNIGTTFGCPWKFHQYGEAGHWVSDLFPHVARCADKLAIVRSMTSEFSEHNAANYFLHTGLGQAGWPSMGAWLSYGLGSECDNLPSFAVINGGLIPSGGMDNFASGFLPAVHEGTLFKPQKLPIANLSPAANLNGSAVDQETQRDLTRDLDGFVSDRLGRPDAIESAIKNYELAYRMQRAVPEVANLDNEPEHIHQLYGMKAEFEPTQVFGRECLLARRMVERGVRFIELTCPRVNGNDRWDAHGNLLKNHGENSRAVDQPIAGLLTDLEQRGMLEETLVVWAGEFGRTPFAQGSDGRDHNPFGFTIWLAGGGIRGGAVYGATDEFGYRVVEGKLTIHDLHATMLHVLGVDHTRLTFRFGGRDMRLTDVHGNVVQDILA